MKKSFFTVALIVTILVGSFMPFGTASAETSPKLCVSFGWGVYPDGVSAIGFNANGENASGWVKLDGGQPVNFESLPYGRGTTTATLLQGQFTGVYATDVASYWHKRISPNSGLTLNFCIEPNAEEPYAVQVLNTSQLPLRIYWQSRYEGEMTTWERSFSGKTAHLELRTTDQDGRWNTVGGITLYPTNWP